MSKKNIVKEATDLGLPVAERMGLYFWSVSYKKEGANWYLRYFIDKDEGINIDECEAFSREVSDLLDEVDIIAESYYLEVSSPGLDRELKEDWHFEKMTGKEVEIKLYSAFEGKQNYIGELLTKTKETISIKESGEIKEFNLKDIVWTRQALDF